MKKQWGIFCIKEEVETIKEKLNKAELEIFEVRPLTVCEKIAYVKDPMMYINDPYIVMFRATKWQYRKFLFNNRLAKVF